MTDAVQITLAIPNAGTIAREFDAIPDEVRRAVRAVVHASSLAIQGDAKRRIQRGPKTGRWYGKHRASAPGQSPASDTGALAGAIHKRMLAEMTDEVSSDVHYGGYLEFGTKKMAPRPYLKPSLDKEEPNFVENIELAVAGAFDV